MQRRSLCLVVWLVGVAALALPEAGMVLYMALQYWVSERASASCPTPTPYHTEPTPAPISVVFQRLQSLYGLTEITCWACRLFINVSTGISLGGWALGWAA